MRASIIIRAYNAERTIGRAIESALAQDFPSDQYEVLVINDGSTDGTTDIVENYLHDPRVRLIRQKNTGIARAANAGIDAARGEYVTFLDADDMFERQLLSTLVPILDKDPTCAFVYPDYLEQRDDRQSLVSPRHLFEALAGGGLFRKTDLASAGGFRDVPLFPEYDLFLRTLDTWNTQHYSGHPLMIYVRHEESLTSDTGDVQGALDNLKKLHPDKLAVIKSIRSYV